MQSGQGADEVFAGYYWYPPLLEAEGDGLEVSMPTPSSTATTTGVASLPARAAGGGSVARVRGRVVLARGRLDGDRPRAAARRRGDARRRPGQARRQHDDGPRARGADAVPRPRAGRAGGGVPAGVQARRGRQGRPEAGGARRGARRGDRPARRATSPCRRCRTSRGRCSSWWPTRCARTRRATAGCSATTWSRTMLRDPNEHRTNLDGSTLWQLGLLELWLQTHLS